MPTGISRRPKLMLVSFPTAIGYMAGMGTSGLRTSRMPTQLSAMLTSRLSCAHFRARCASLAARSVRFCWRWIWTISATLFRRQPLCFHFVPDLAYSGCRTHPSCLGACSRVPAQPPSLLPSPGLCPRKAAQPDSLVHSAPPTSLPG